MSVQLKCHLLRTKLSCVIFSVFNRHSLTTSVSHPTSFQLSAKTFKIYRALASTSPKKGCHQITSRIYRRNFLAFVAFPPDVLTAVSRNAFDLWFSFCSVTIKVHVTACLLELTVLDKLVCVPGPLSFYLAQN